MNIITTEKTPTICLNMIVKNESHIIQNTLEKLCDKIKFDYWVICDTGSTDNTPQIIIDFFKKKSIKGELFYDEWVNFAYNRTLALKRAYKKTQLLLIFDADDEIVGNIQMPTNVLFDEYHLKFGSEGFMYTRVLLINNYKIFEFLSVIHEFIVCKEQPCKTNVINGDYYVVSGRTGSRNLDKDKYLKDALILEKAYKEALEKNDFLFHRYSYYCANSYRDCGRFEDAIKWYKISLNHEKQWEQEKYTACLYIYQCYTSLNQEDTGFFYLVKSLKYDNERVDCLFPLLVYYCRENMFNVAYNYYLIVKDFFENKYLKTDLTNKLFVNIDKFNFFVPYYMIIVSEKVQDFKCAIRMYEIIFTKKHHMFEKSYIKDILYNLQFFFQFVKDDNNFIKLTNDYIDFLHLNNVNIQHFDFLKNNVYIKAGLKLDKYFPKQKSLELQKSKKFSKNDCLSSKNILIFTGFSDVNWNYSFMLNKALGGSEKAVAYISRCFPKDYNIFISGYVAYETIENVTYIPLNNLTQLIENTAFNTIIVSRYISFYEMFKECSFYQSYIWAHDTELISYGSSLDATQILTKWNNHINGCICLTEWHQKVFIEKYPILTNKINIINNGIDINSFKKFNKPNKIKNKFIYTSRPERGLNLLLNLWQQILAKIPDATLSISSYVNFPSTPEDVLLKNIIDNTDSITYLGNLNVNKLYEEMSSSEYWLYPTHYPETSCITALEMLMSEVICLYYPVAGLPYTIDKYGIQVSPNSEIDTIVSLTDEQKTQLKQNGKLYAKSCSWTIRAKSWTKMLFNNNTLSKESHNNIYL
jgi:glycosyltransferase involved in cell wall biosynthesis